MWSENAVTDVDANPLIVYVHVPKTAGSAIKKVLGLCTPRGHAYVEQVIHDKSAFLDLARSSDWIAGHLPIEVLSSRLTWVGRPVEFFSSVREPTAQLASQLNFSFERYHRKNYYDQHSHNEQVTDMIVMSTDFSNPASVLNLLVNLFGQHLNMQSRLLLGDDFESLTDQEVRRRLECYACVATEDTVGKLYSAFGFAELPEGCEQLRENVARRYIDTAIFDSPQVREFLAHRHRHDYRLYDAVKRMSWPAEARAPVRPALLGGRSFTFDNFDEQVYLDSNPDVANAVKLGHVQSGRHHFFATGHSEERMGRHWVLPRAAVDEVTS